MREFPKLVEGQFALMAAQRNTGYILDVNLQIVFNDDQFPYMIFNNKEEALQYAHRRINEIGNLEYVLYDHRKEAVQFIEP